MSDVKENPPAPVVPSESLLERAEAAESSLESLREILKGAVEREGAERERAWAAESSLAQLRARVFAVELRLKHELWNNHGCPMMAQYGDDGEMQCNAKGCATDFLRMPINELLPRVDRLRRESAERKLAAAAPPAGESQEEGKSDV